MWVLVLTLLTMGNGAIKDVSDKLYTPYITSSSIEVVSEFKSREACEIAAEAWKAELIPETIGSTVCVSKKVQKQHK